jgi:hypothetical protein
MAKGPKPPDPYATAQAQANANFVGAQQNAIMGNVNEYTPYGSKTYQQIGWDPVYDSNGKLTYAPRYSSTVALSPDQQRLLGQQTGIQYNIGNLGLSQSSRLQSLLGKEMNTEGLQGWSTGKAPGTLTGQIANAGQIRQDQGPTDRAAIENAMMQSYSRARAPSIRAEEAQLAARGLSPGGAGYGAVQQGREDAYGEAARQAYLGSGQESRAAQEAYNQAQNQRFAQNERMASFANQATQGNYELQNNYANFLNNLRQGQMQERVALRNQPINEIMALLGGSGVTTPQFQPFQSPNINPVNVGQYIYDNYNTQAQQAAARNQGLFGLAGAGMSLAMAPWTGGTSMLGHFLG